MGLIAPEGLYVYVHIVQGGFVDAGRRSSAVATVGRIIPAADRASMTPAGHHRSRPTATPADCSVGPAGTRSRSCSTIGSNQPLVTDRSSMKVGAREKLGFFGWEGNC